MKNHNWKSNYSSTLQSEIDKIKDEGHYRVFNNIDRKAGQYPKATRHSNGQTEEIDVWCSNDYLGMSQNKEVISAMQSAAEKLGAGSGGTRNISGTTNFHIQLEKEIALLHKKERALAFNSGYSANESALKSIISAFDNCLVLSDELNHASLIEGIRTSKKEKAIYRHNDVKHLKDILKGVDFFWTTKAMFFPMVFMIISLLIIFYFYDSFQYRKESDIPPSTDNEKIAIKGSFNLLLIAGVVFSVLLSGFWKPHTSFNIYFVHVELQNMIRDVILLALTYVSWTMTSKEIRTKNEFTWFPIEEVAKLFAGLSGTILSDIAIF